MSFLNWFSCKPATVSPQPAVPGAVRYREHSRLQRHARRDQLYVAIRDAMTRAGVLSASYKFKVLSLDQPGEKFMVMLDLAQGFEGAPGQLAVMEALIIQNAKARCEVMVPAVYWRFDEVAAVRKPGPALHKGGTRAALQAASPESLRRQAPVPGFSDTAMPDAAALPALSSTQYGELR